MNHLLQLLKMGMRNMSDEHVRRIVCDPLPPAVKGEDLPTDRASRLNGWAQDRISAGRVDVVGDGGMGAVVDSLLVHLGLASLGIVDYDVVDRPALSKTLFRRKALYQPKVFAQIEDLKEQAIAPTELMAYEMSFENYYKKYPERLRSVDLVIILVDSNRVRHIAAEVCKKNKKAVIFAGVSADAESLYVFYQSPDGHPCFSCVRDREADIAADIKNPCKIPAVIYSYSVVAGFVVYLATKYLCGLPIPWNWRDFHFGLSTNDDIRSPKADPHCIVCGDGKKPVPVEVASSKSDSNSGIRRLD